MCEGISLQYRQLSEETIRRHRLNRRIFRRAPQAEPELRFLIRESMPMIPAWHARSLEIYRWGDSGGRGSGLPQSFWCPEESLNSGPWNGIRLEPVEIPADCCLENGFWYQVGEGIRGVLVHNQRGYGHVYVLTRPASHYHRVMTRSDRMPVVISPGRVF